MWSLKKFTFAIRIKGKKIARKREISYASTYCEKELKRTEHFLKKDPGSQKVARNCNVGDRRLEVNIKGKSTVYTRV
jgi:hypothetical protein